MFRIMKTLVAGGLFGACAIASGAASAQEAASCITAVTFDQAVAGGFTGQRTTVGKWGVLSGGAVGETGVQYDFGPLTLHLFAEIAPQSRRECLEDLAVRVTRLGAVPETPPGYAYLGKWRPDRGGATAATGEHRDEAMVWLYARKAVQGAPQVLGEIRYFASSEDAWFFESTSRKALPAPWRLKGVWDPTGVAWAGDLDTIWGKCERLPVILETGVCGAWHTGLFTKPVDNVAGRDPTTVATAFGGRWALLTQCPGCPEGQYTYSVGVANGKDVEKAKEFSKSLSVMLGGELEHEFGIGKATAKIEVTGALDSLTRDSVVTSLQRSAEDGILQSCDRGALWQWQSSITWAQGESTLAKAQRLVCTVVGDAPADPNDVDWQGCDVEQVVGTVVDAEKLGPNARYEVALDWRCKQPG